MELQPREQSLSVLLILPVVNSVAFHMGMLGWLFYWWFPFPFVATTFFAFHAFVTALFSRRFCLALSHVLETVSGPSVHFLKFDFF